MAKLNRESKLRERRMEKHARKDARKRTAAGQDAPSSDVTQDAGPDGVGPPGHDAGDVAQSAIDGAPSATAVDEPRIADQVDADVPGAQIGIR
jgi:hypothetical protein